jgi:hypothetical protein
VALPRTARAVRRSRVFRGRGLRYRQALSDHVFNIQELDADGEEARAWCFAPDGVATGDVNLAQKIALETFESKALAIANRSSGTTWYQIEQPADEPRSSLQWISRAAAPAIGYCLIGAVVLVAIISGIHTFDGRRLRYAAQALHMGASY